MNQSREFEAEKYYASVLRQTGYLHTTHSAKTWLNYLRYEQCAILTREFYHNIIPEGRCADFCKIEQELCRAVQFHGYKVIPNEKPQLDIEK